MHSKHRHWMILIFTSSLNEKLIPNSNRLPFYLYITKPFLPIKYMKPFVRSLSKLVFISLISPLLLSSFTFHSPLAQAAANNPLSKVPTYTFQTYSNSVFGITMQYPSNWSRTELSHNNSAFLIVVFRTPSILGSLNILAINHISAKNATLPTLVNAYIDHLRQSGKLLQLLSSTQTNLAGKPATRFVYTTISPQGAKFQLMQEISLIGNKTFFITYGSPTASYPTYLPAIQRMIDSIKIK